MLLGTQVENIFRANTQAGRRRHAVGRTPTALAAAGRGSRRAALSFANTQPPCILACDAINGRWRLPQPAFDVAAQWSWPSTCHFMNCGAISRDCFALMSFLLRYTAVASASHPQRGA